MFGTWDFLEEYDYLGHNLIHYDHKVIILREVLNNNRREWKYFGSWLDAFQFLYFFTMSTKRRWIESLTNRGVISIIWDTDLEIYEQELIKDIQEIYDYKYSSLGIDELEEIKADTTEEEMQKSINDLIYALDFIYKKDAIEMN